jgi:hypothetical protein
VFIIYLYVGNSPYHRENIELLYVFTFKVITEVLSTPPSPLVFILIIIGIKIRRRQRFILTPYPPLLLTLYFRRGIDGGRRRIKIRRRNKGL